MGADAMEGRILCLLPFPEPKPLTNYLRDRHPRLELTYVTIQLGPDWKKNEDISSDIWKDVIVLFTLAVLPPNPALAPRLKLVHLLSAGTDHLWDHPIYTHSKVPITTCTGVAAPVIAEWVLMSILTASRKYNVLREWQLQQSWDQSGAGKAQFLTSSSAAGKRIGILGYGAVGRQVANVCKTLGMEIVVHTASPRPSAESKRYSGYIVPGTGDPEGKVPVQWHSGIDKSSLHAFLEQDLDYLLISIPLTDTTRGLLGKDELSTLTKRNAFLLNISRGEVLDQEALLQALHEFENDKSANSDEPCRGLSGAALDVTVPEPLPPKHLLWDAPNVFISPHISGISKEHAGHAFRILDQNLAQMADGKKLLNEIERSTGYSSRRSNL